MVRFYKSYLGRLLLGMLILIELEREKGREGVIDIIAKWNSGSDSERVVLADAIEYYANDYPEESPTNDDVLKGTFGQLLKRKNDELDLLDTVVNLLRLPFASYLTGSHIKALREAVLRPSELSEVRKALKAAPMCSCGHEVQRDEMCSLELDGDLIRVRCTSCRRPSYIKCDYCQNVVPITTKVTGSWRNGINCGCRAKKQPELTIEQIGQAQQAAEMRIFRRQVRAAAAPTFRGNAANIANMGTPVLEVTEAPIPPLTPDVIVPGDFDPFR